MITLITGSLGTGKTAFAIKLLTEHSYYPDNAVIVGVREWQGGGAYYPLKSMQDATANQRMIEEIGGLSGTIYFVDEAKKIWPSRIAGKPVPQFIDSHLAESRSIAQDWILTAQTPTQIDVALRRLVGRHIHLERNALGVKYSEAGQVRDDLKFSRDESRKYQFPVESLTLYKSDDGVTDLQKKGLKLPKRLLFLLFLIIFLFIVIGYFVSQSSMFGTAVSPHQTIEEPTNELTKVMNSPKVQTNGQQKDEVLPLSLAPSIYYYLPRDPSYPEIAKAPRLPLSCLRRNENECICYDQYNQRIESFPLKRCNDIIDGVNPLAFTRDKRNI
ncbi:zonular occludens toxin domain-containing protein [Nitrosomonas sp.]|uniref:zonular occludens toxin domain-containing protein n=1 Tax=Nitrosomonas sp. TaxID=42353 RepID=UPI00283F4725|nr:zonular occludens toxin domain-containing protein [Nitrosomonas sp.]MDR4513156.1 zonular occludens toxin domain-containing protein [Nitrosomonas sp.]